MGEKTSDETHEINKTNKTRQKGNGIKDSRKTQPHSHGEQCGGWGGGGVGGLWERGSCGAGGNVGRGPWRLWSKRELCERCGGVWVGGGGGVGGGTGGGLCKTTREASGKCDHGVCWWRGETTWVGGGISLVKSGKGWGEKGTRRREKGKGENKK